MKTPNNKLDAVLCTVPFVNPSSPLIGTAILKTHAEKHGYKVRCVDFNVDLWQMSQEPGLFHDCYEKLQNPKFHIEMAGAWNTAIEKWAHQLAESSADLIGFCAFSFISERPIIDLCKRLREISDKKLLIGGPGAKTVGVTAKEQGLCDYYLCGDAEDSFLKLLNGEEFPALNSNQHIGSTPIQETPLPNYTDYDLSQFKPVHGDKGCEQFYISSSKGCVRNCSFCDVANIWDKYQFQPAEKTVKEMTHLYETHGIKRFHFTDSLINGSTKNLRTKCEGLIQHYKDNKIDPFEWRGYAIIRPRASMKPEMFDLMKDSGCYLLSLGIEAGSERVRGLMNKKFANDDLDYTMEQVDRVGIKALMLVMVGYPGETEADFQETMDMFSRYSKYAQRGTVDVVTISILMFLAGTPLLAEHHDIDVSSLESRIDWDIDGLQLEERLDRFYRLKAHATSLGYNVGETEIEHLWQEVYRKSKAQNPSLEKTL